MQCNLTKECQGTLQIEPEQDDAIKYSLKCDTCGERHIVQRSKAELIELYERRVKLLKADIDIHSIYADEAQEILHYVSVPDADLKHLHIAQDLAHKLEGGSKCSGLSDI